MTTIKVLDIISLPALSRGYVGGGWSGRIDSASSLNRVVANANLSRFDRRRVVRFRRTRVTKG